MIQWHILERTSTFLKSTLRETLSLQVKQAEAEFVPDEMHTIVLLLVLNQPLQFTANKVQKASTIARSFKGAQGLRQKMINMCAAVW